jgi:hypothetical protein
VGGAKAPAIDVASTGSTGAIPLSAAPTPYPASLRPTVPVIVTAPTTTITTVAKTSDEAPLILDEDLVKRREAAVSAVLEPEVGPVQEPRVITGDDLEEWDSGSLADYLERRGMLSEGESQASASSDFDEDGFFLDEGPNESDARRVVRRLPRRNNDFFFF